jgi:hypothetical protein
MSDDLPPLWSEADGHIAVMSSATHREWSRFTGELRDLPVELREEVPYGTVMITTREGLAFSEGPPPVEMQQWLSPHPTRAEDA